MSYPNPFDFEKPFELLNRLFGAQIETFLQEPQTLRNRFGAWTKRIRLEKAWPPGAQGPTAHMTEAIFAARFNAAWWRVFHQICSKGERWVRKLEAGQIPLNPGVIMCVALALEADELEAALLLEAAGWGGWINFLLRRMATILSICDIIENETGLSLDEVKHLLKLQLEIECKEAFRLLSSNYAS